MEGERVALKDNVKVEEALGKHGVICVEDIVHELATSGKHFVEVASALVPFKLNPPADGFKVKMRAFHHGGDWGDRETNMNGLVQKML